MKDYEQLYESAMTALKVKDAELNDLSGKVDALNKELTSTRIEYQRAAGSLKTAKVALAVKTNEIAKLTKGIADKESVITSNRVEHNYAVKKLQDACAISKQKHDLMETDMKILRTKLDKANVDLVTERKRHVQPELKKKRDTLTISEDSKALAGLQREITTLRTRLNQYEIDMKRIKSANQLLQKKLDDSNVALQAFVDEKYPERLENKDQVIKTLRDKVNELTVEATKDGFEIAKLRERIKNQGA